MPAGVHWYNPVVGVLPPPRAPKSTFPAELTSGAENSWNVVSGRPGTGSAVVAMGFAFPPSTRMRDRKSTRLNSSHGYISYAVFCLKKKKKNMSDAYT